ncbi:bifunctional adenosylcobinamide kinase/adenosylcobinamide-phosphate guanylyltransferase [Rhodobacterales bacterium]|nr:bifunctional adenosylcobinamide kinase/adenosylcobinamide-phosphate guanylyltransferase [Rhodobacterales bacterium]
MASSQSPRTILVLGGARSGKSRYAEALADRSGLSKTYVATGAAFDDEMAERIRLHKVQRGTAWKTVEEQMDLPSVLKAECRPDCVVLVDCLTLWLSNLLFREQDMAAAAQSLQETLPSLEGPCIFVSNETGMGIVPEHRLSRTFRDAQGRLNQDIARICDTVVFVAAGLPMVLKPNSQPDIIL